MVAEEEKVKMDCFGTAISESMPPEISPWPSSKPTSPSRTNSRSSRVLSVPSSAYTTATVALKPLATSAITCSGISKVRGFETLQFIGFLVLEVFNSPRLNPIYM